MAAAPTTAVSAAAAAGKEKAKQGARLTRSLEELHQQSTHKAKPFLLIVGESAKLQCMLATLVVKLNGLPYGGGSGCNCHATAKATQQTANYLEQVLNHFLVLKVAGGRL